jgi:outer membrane usher protein
MLRRDRVADTRWPGAALFVLLAIASAQASAADSDADQTLLLAVTVNDHPTNEIGRFVLRHGGLYAAPGELSDLGFRVPSSAVAPGQSLVPLAGLPDVAYRLDQATQTLYVTAGVASLLPTVLGSWTQYKSKVRVESGTGATLNYDIIGTATGDRRYGSGLFDARAFFPWGVFSSGFLVFAGDADSAHRGRSAIRLDTTYVYSDPNALRRYRLGDFITGFLSWTRPVRLGGAQISSDFSLRPDLITFPLPSVAGSVAVPSTVDVLVNGNHVLTTPVQPGPFQIPQLPVITGAGTVNLTVTNALGQQVTTEMPFYAAPNLLAPGLQTWSLEVGATRRNWGVISNDYGRFALSATWRRGLSDKLTLEGHVEATSGMFMGGVGIVRTLANFAVANVAVAGSGGNGHSGAQVAVGLQRTTRWLSFGFSTIVATRYFRDIATVEGDPVVRLQVGANIGVNLGRFGSIGVAYVGVKRSAPSNFRLGSAGPPPLEPAEPLPILPLERSHIVSASYSKQFARVSAFVTGFHDFVHHDGNGVFLGATIPIGRRASAQFSAQSESGTHSAQVQATQSVQTIGDWGYRALLSGDGQVHGFAELSYKAGWALLTAGLDRNGGQTTAQGELRGAVSVADHGLFLSNWIDDSFAIVDTNGVGGVMVRQENRDVGRTDADGKRLVPDLRSFEQNRIAIEPLDVPPDVTVPYTQRLVRPQDRSGITIRFALKRSSSALLRLTDETGRPLPVGSAATLASTGKAVPVGYDGAAYLLDLLPHNEIRVELPDGRRCAASFDYRVTSGQIPTIGPVVCREAAP